MSMHRLVCSAIMMMVFPEMVWAWDPQTECPNPPQDATQAQIVAGEMFAEAEADYEADRPLEALKGFLCSHRIIQHENTLFNIAQIAKLEERREEVVLVLKDFVAHSKGEQMTKPIEEIIDDLEQKTLPEEEVVDVATSDEESVTQPPEPATSTDVSESEAKTDPSPTPEEGMKLAGVTLLVLGGATLVTGAIFQGLAGRSQTDAEESERFSAFEDAQTEMEMFQKVAVTGFIAGGVFSGVGVVLYVLSRNNESSQSSGLALVPGWRGVALFGRF